MRTGASGLARIAVLLAGLCLVPFAPPARAAELERFGAEAFAAAGRLEFVRRPLAQAELVEVRSDGRLQGWTFSTWDVVRSLGYSGQPVDILVALDAQLAIRSARLVRHNEPILILGIDPARLDAFVAGLAGLDIRSLAATRTVRREGGADAIAGATVSSNVLRDAVVRSARVAARAAGAFGRAERTLLRDRFEPATWPMLVASGAIASRRITQADLAAASATAADDPALLLSEIHVALATPAGIGRNLLGRTLHDELAARAGPEDELILVAARGLVSFKGTQWRRSGVFERIALVQDGRRIALTEAMHRNLERLAAASAPELREAALFTLPAASGFDPTRPWRLQLAIARPAPDGAPAAALFDVDYRVPEAYVASSAAAEPPLWRTAWRERAAELAALVAMLAALLLILVFQDQVAARPRLYRGLRVGFLAATVLFLGLVARTQLSTVHVLTFAQALRTDFKWELFLLDPLVFVLWSFVALALLFWGRVFCGWLCPFGALQDLVHGLARRLGVRQVEVPWAVHERLWMLKYLAFLAIFAVSLTSIAAAFTASEVEPFKTVVALHFRREWPFVAYALALIAAGLFVRRFFCRYLCPLGAALAIPARLRIFEWLKRRPQCGRECRKCNVACPVGAIYPSGRISPNECIYCLKCQEMYHDPRVCLGLRAREERRQARAQLGLCVPGASHGG